MTARQVALDYLDALNAHDPDRIAACVTEDFVNEHTSALGSSLVGRAAYRERLPSFLGAFDELRYECEDVVTEDDKVVVAYRMGGAWGGRPFELRGVFRFRVEGRHIASRVDYWDSALFQQQVGAG